jgi:hypothetical protein
MDDDREIFHSSIVAKLLYVLKRGRLDIRLAIAFLCTRVSCSMEKDWLKLKRVLEYLRARRVSNAPSRQPRHHEDMGGCVICSTQGHEEPHRRCCVIWPRSRDEQILQTKAEYKELHGSGTGRRKRLSTVSYMGKRPSWKHRYTLKDNVFHQDNQSTIRFKKNGRKSCGPNPRHIDIRYFFIQNRIGLANIDVQLCPTEQMLADFFTKPLQGNLFQKFREVILGYKHIDSLKRTMPTKSQERVEKDSLPANKWNEVDGRKTDARTTEPAKRTYDEIIKKRKLSWKREETSTRTSHFQELIPS